MERLKISENKRYLVTESGKPFPWLADTVWTMPQRLKWDEVDYLMKKRVSQGFTALQICALDPERDVEMRSPAGQPALLDGDLSRPNEKYFEYLDYVLDRAEAYGLYVLLLPVWGQLVVGDDWGGGTYEKTVREDNAWEYGRWIGQRYKDRTNILWCLGGDRMPIHKGVDYRQVWRRMAEGLAKGLTGQDVRHNESSPVWEELLITYHACHEMETGLCSTFSYWDDSEQWIRFIMLQSGHGSEPKNYELVRAEYERENVMPVWDGEPAYEMMPTCWPKDENVPRHGSWMVRKRAYWSLLAGSFGHTYGHGSVWASVGERELNLMGPITWTQAADNEGANQMCHLRAFMESLAPMTAAPCRQIFTEAARREGTLDTHAEALAGADWVCAYLPGGGSVELDLSSLFVSERLLARWWSPRDGQFAGDGITVDAGSPLTLTAPTAGDGEDWILLLTKMDSDVTITPFQTEIIINKETAKKVFDW